MLWTRLNILIILLIREFKFDPISEAPGVIAEKLTKIANRTGKFISLLDTTPVGPFHPYEDYLECGLLDEDLEKDFKEMFGKKARLKPKESLEYLAAMFKKYPEMKGLYHAPQNWLNKAEANSKNHWYYKMRK